MRVPPPFALTLSPSAGLQRALRLLAGLAWGVGLAWAAARLDAPAAAVGAAFALCFSAGAGAAAALRPPACRWLAWSGSGWTLDGRSGTLEVAIDLGGWMLLRLRPDGAAGRLPWRCAWLETRATAPESSWVALRAALFAASDPDAAAMPAAF